MSPFFDTNILLYVYSDADPDKQKRARELYREQALSGAIFAAVGLDLQFASSPPGEMIRTASNSSLDCTHTSQVRVMAPAASIARWECPGAAALDPVGSA